MKLWRHPLGGAAVLMLESESLGKKSLPAEGLAHPSRSQIVGCASFVESTHVVYNAFASTLL